MVAVPTKNRLAFSPPAFRGWSFVSFAFGRDSLNWRVDEKSRVGGMAILGSIVRRFMILDCRRTRRSLSVGRDCWERSDRIDGGEMDRSMMTTEVLTIEHPVRKGEGLAPMLQYCFLYEY